MSSFTEPLVVTPLSDGVRWKLERSFVYDIGELGGSDNIVVPKDFKTDFGSVPKIFWNIVSPIGKAVGAYVLHDYLYATQERSRLVADAILLEALEVLKVNWFQRWLIYRGVRMGGMFAWKANAKKKVK